MSESVPSFRLALLACLMVPALATAHPSAAAGPDSLKYWILFSDRGPVNEHLSSAVEIPLDERALQRRRVRGTGKTQETDRPVFIYYINTLHDLGVQKIVTSRWLNGISAYLTSDAVERVRDLPFVREIRPVGTAVVGTAAALDLRDDSPASPLYSGAPNATYGPSETQLDLVNDIPVLEQGYDGTGVRLGFLDTTFEDFNHPAFNDLRTENRLIEVRDFTGLSQSNTHGRRVASIAAGFIDGQLVGPAHGAEIVAATTEFAPNETNQEEDNFVAGMEWLESMGVDVVSISLGYTTFDEGENSYTQADLDGDTGITTIASDIAAQHGVVVVASAGNWVDAGCASPAGCWYYVGTPADGDSVIAVGAVDGFGTKASFSSFGPTADGRIKPDVSAMGVSVYHASSTTGLGYGNGTSFSAPMVSGVVCQILQANPSLAPMEVLDILRRSASQSQSPDNALGWGVINAEIAVSTAIAVGVEHVQPGEAFRVKAYPNPFADRITFSFETTSPGPTTVRVYDLLGREVARPLDGPLSAGRHSRIWNAGALASGVYVVVATSTEGTYTGRIVRI